MAELQELTAGLAPQTEVCSLARLRISELAASSFVYVGVQTQSLRSARAEKHSIPASLLHSIRSESAQDRCTAREPGHSSSVDIRRAQADVWEAEQQACGTCRSNGGEGADAAALGGHHHHRGMQVLQGQLSAGAGSERFLVQRTAETVHCCVQKTKEAFRKGDIDFEEVQPVFLHDARKLSCT